MFEKEIQAAKNNLSHSLLSGASYVYLREILEKNDIHRFYHTFFSAEVNWWIFEQQILRDTNPRFDYTSDDLAGIVREMDRLCRQYARFDHQDITSLIDLSVKTRVNFLIRPRTTLKWFVYRGEPTKPLREVLLRLAYFSEYSYLTEGFHSWIQQRNTTSPLDILSVIEFERIIQNIDNDIILEYTTTEFTDLLHPLFEFFHELAPLHTPGVIPTPALIIFLDDKGIIRISQELERLLKEEQWEYISKEQFLQVIDNVIQEVEEETVVVPDAEDATIPLAFEGNSANPDKPENAVAHDSGDVESADTELTPEVPVPVEMESLVEMEAIETELPADTEFPVEADKAEEESIPIESVVTDTAHPDETAEKEEHNLVQTEAESEKMKNQAQEEIPLPTDTSPADGMPAFPEKASISGQIHTPERNIPDFELNKRLIDSIFGPAPEEQEAERKESARTEEKIPQSKEIQHESDEESVRPISTRTLQPLQQFFDSENSHRLIKKLFRKNEQQFNLALERLNSIQSWKEASSAIDKIYAEQGIDPFSSLAKKFTEIVYTRYIPGG